MAEHKDIRVPLTVGSVSDLDTLRAVDSDDTPQFDILELRLDGLQQAEIEEAHRLSLRVQSWGVPILITMRDVSEGGIQQLSTEEKEARLQLFAEVASYVDVEIANYTYFKHTLEGMQSNGVKTVLSYHNFEQTPTTLQEQYERAVEFGADIPKFALMHQSTADVHRCAEFIQSVELPISLMGMGALAPVSRLLYAQLGSVLNYGYLGATATAPGQWSAAFLKQAIAQLELIQKA